MFYKYWLNYLIFIRNIYSKRWRGINVAATSLAQACLIIILLFIAVLLDFVFDLNGMMFLLSKGLPLGPMAIGLGFLLLLPTLLLNKLSIQNKSKTIRNALIEVQSLKKVYTVLFLVLTFILFLLTVLLVIAQS